ncbi:MAG: cation:proton antiporter [Bacteroidota bacterium]|nr:cation:proton antiporter [Bacteroidota bacterium]
MNAYIVVIAASITIIISYFFNLLSKKTNVPSVLMLIVFGILIKQVMNLSGVGGINWFPYLEVLGIIGLIMIVLEAALDLELTREKRVLIWKSLIIALLSLLLIGGAISLLLMWILNLDITSAMLYAVPLSVMSSAIVIPSVANLTGDNKEFMIYESTFSDIFGIMIFYFILSGTEVESAKLMWMGGFFNVLMTILISFVVSYGLILLFQNIKSENKLVLLVAVLVLLYTVAKQFHLSSLLIILIFGLILCNRHIFFMGKLDKYLKKAEVNEIYTNFRMITIESSFVLRTFFFVIFGITITLSSLFSYKVLLLSLVFLAMIYGIRYLLLLVFCRKDRQPKLWLAPRGLITVLLFYSIPKEYMAESFDQGVLLYVIIITNLIMGYGLMKHGQKTRKMKLSEQSMEIDVENNEDNDNKNDIDNDNNEHELKDESDENSEK